MAWTQHVMTVTQARAAGVDTGGRPDTDVAVVCSDDGGAVAWVSYATSDVDPATRVNPSVPAQDWRIR